MSTPESSRSVVITGMGASTAVGETIQDLWEAATGVHPPLLDPTEAGPEYDAVARAQRWVIAATDEALRQADLWDGHTLQNTDKERVACTVSASKPLPNAAGDFQGPEIIATLLRRRFGFAGESRNVVAACATGAYGAALGASWIRDGLYDIVLVGSVEPRPHSLYAAGFQRMGVLSAENVMRPFDTQRSGFVFGEGAGVLVLESAASARRRSVRPLAYLSGWGLGADTHSAYAFNSGGALIAQVIDKALGSAGLLAEDIDYVNAHGTATRHNDSIEAQALKRVFASHTETLKISATKSSTGHLLGAAGSIELILTILALQRQKVPPTRHLQQQETDCAFDLTPNTACVVPMRHALTLSFGFGGPIGALTVSRV